MTLSPATAMKALRIFKSARVTEITDARAFDVIGDEGDTYTVVVSSTRLFCPCESRAVPCKHLAAIGLQIRSEPLMTTTVEWRANASDEHRELATPWGSLEDAREAAEDWRSNAEPAYEDVYLEQREVTAPARVTHEACGDVGCITCTTPG